jgi:hypothetical protein
LAPEDENFPMRSIGRETKIHTWDEIKPFYDEVKAKRSKEWTKS